MKNCTVKMQQCEECSDWLFCYVKQLNHPRMASTGSEGRCELCGSSYDGIGFHQEPYARICKKDVYDL